MCWLQQVALCRGLLASQLASEGCKTAVDLGSEFRWVAAVQVSSKLLTLGDLHCRTGVQLTVTGAFACSTCQQPYCAFAMPPMHLHVASVSPSVSCLLPAACQQAQQHSTRTIS